MNESRSDSPNWVPANVYGNAQFIAEAVHRFPWLKSDFQEDTESLHLQMATLAEAVRLALEQGSTDLPLDVCSFLAGVLQNPNVISEIENAVAISFVEVEELRASESGLKVLARMPPKLRDALLTQRGRRPDPPVVR